MIVVVHHLNNSRPQRLLWLLEEHGLPYEIKRYQRGPEVDAGDAGRFHARPACRRVLQHGGAYTLTG